jgi:hypothetical protein
MANLGPQFKGPGFSGFANPKTQGGVNRPERAGEEGTAPKGDHRGRITAELSNHPKKIGFKLFTRGLQSMGVHPNKENLARIAGLIDSDNAKFHDLVKTARKNAMGEKQRLAERKKGFQS